MRLKRWTREQLHDAAEKSRSIRGILHKLGLKEAGGNYAQIKKYLHLYKINIAHFTGKAWNKGLKMPFSPKIPTEKILVRKSTFQSYKLKARLLCEELKRAQCELCGWAEQSPDGRIPLELDHINGDSRDNRLSNLRILCPNCHSLQPTHRGRNRNKRASGGIGIRATLKML